MTTYNEKINLAIEEVRKALEAEAEKGKDGKFLSYDEMNRIFCSYLWSEDELIKLVQPSLTYKGSLEITGRTTTNSYKNNIVLDVKFSNSQTYEYNRNVLCELTEPEELRKTYYAKLEEDEISYYVRVLEASEKVLNEVKSKLVLHGGNITELRTKYHTDNFEKEDLIGFIEFEMEKQ